MSLTTGISWADSTASPWFGCTEVSPGCANCYAREMTLRRKWAGWGDNAPRVKSRGFEKNVRAWNRKIEYQRFCWASERPFNERNGARCPIQTPRVFPSLMDWLDPQVPIEWLADLVRVIYGCPNLDFLLLTKRPELFRERLLKIAEDWCDGVFPLNVWIGVTCEDQKRADERIPELLKIPARVRFVSVEPLLEPIEFGAVPGGLVSPIYQDRRCKIDWVIVGGESGPKRRDCGVEAICDVAQQCVTAGVTVWVKQDCAAKPGQQGRISEEIWKLKQFPNL